MSDLPDRELLDVMGFIIDSVAKETEQTGRAEMGLYLISLVLAECQRGERNRGSEGPSGYNVSGAR